MRQRSPSSLPRTQAAGSNRLPLPCLHGQTAGSPRQVSNSHNSSALSRALPGCRDRGQQRGFHQRTCPEQNKNRARETLTLYLCPGGKAGILPEDSSCFRSEDTPAAHRPALPFLTQIPGSPWDLTETYPPGAALTRNRTVPPPSSSKRGHSPTGHPGRWDKPTAAAGGAATGEREAPTASPSL